MSDLRKERREPNGTPLPTRGEGLGWGIIFLKNKKLHTPPLPLPFMGGRTRFFLFGTPSAEMSIASSIVIFTYLMLHLAMRLSASSVFSWVPKAVKRT